MTTSLTLGQLIERLQALEQKFGASFPVGIECGGVAPSTIDDVRGVYEAHWPGLVVISNEVQE